MNKQQTLLLLLDSQLVVNDVSLGLEKDYM